MQTGQKSICGKVWVVFLQSSQTTFYETKGSVRSEILTAQTFDKWQIYRKVKSTFPIGRIFLKIP